jgi:hypothetical protein
MAESPFGDVQLKFCHHFFLWPFYDPLHRIFHVFMLGWQNAIPWHTHCDIMNITFNCCTRSLFRTHVIHTIGEQLAWQGLLGTNEKYDFNFCITVILGCLLVIILMYISKSGMVFRNGSKLCPLLSY